MFVEQNGSVAVQIAGWIYWPGFVCLGTWVGHGKHLLNI